APLLASSNCTVPHVGRPSVGETMELEITVTPEITARLFDREIHAVYGTQWMVPHVEESGRLIVERHFEPTEDATGYAIELTHERPARVGDVVVVEAKVVRADARECVTDHEVRGPDGLV